MSALSALSPLTRAAVSWVSVCLTLGDCVLPTGGSAPINYYVLNARAVADPHLVSGPTGMIGIQTVQLPDYLNQRLIVTRPQENAIDVAELDQWAGALSDNITNVVVENLSKLLGTERVIPLPVTAAVPVEDVVGIEIIGFERQPSATVRLSARWIVLGGSGRTFRAVHQSVYEAGNVSGDYVSIASAMSDLLAAFSRDIAQTLATPTMPPTFTEQPLG